MIDIHTHTFSKKIAARAIAQMERESRMAAVTDGLPETLSCNARRAHLDRCVVLPVATNPAQPRKLNDLAVAANERTAETGLLYFGAMHPDDAAWREELRFLKEHGVKGIKLHPMYQGVALDDIRYVRIVAEAAALGMAVTIHMGEDIGIPGPAKGTPGNALALLKETQADKLVLAHLGSWNMWESVLDELAGAAVYMDTAFCFGQTSYNPLYPRSEEERRLGETELLLKIIRKHGADRILFGSDSPWTDQRAEVEKIRALPLSDREKEMILGENAKALLSL